MKVEEFREDLPKGRNKDFYRGFYICARSQFLNTIQAVAHASQYFIDTDDPDFVELDDKIFELWRLINRIQERIEKEK